MSTVTERVERGAELLDEKIPGWEARIDLDTLAVSSHCRCVVGQVYGGYSSGVGKLGVANRMRAAEHGFNSFHERTDHYGPLTRAWRSLIRARLASREEGQ